MNNIKVASGCLVLMLISFLLIYSARAKYKNYELSKHIETLESENSTVKSTLNSQRDTTKRYHYAVQNIKNLDSKIYQGLSEVTHSVSTAKSFNIQINCEINNINNLDISCQE